MRAPAIFLLASFVSIQCAAQGIPKIGAIGTGVLGSAYKTDKQAFVGQECVQGKSVPTGQSESSFALDAAMSESEVSNALGFSAGVRARYGLYDGSAQASFYSRSVSNALSVSSVFSSYYSFPTEKLTSVGYTALGEKVDPNDDRWNETCGDSYVEELKRGARLFISIRIDFASMEQKQDFQAKVDVNGPAFGLNTKIENASQSLAKNSRVTVSAYQMGGDVSKVTDIFPSDDAGRSVFINCTLGQFDACAKFMTKALTYAFDTQNGFPSQFKPNDKGVLAKAAVLDYTIRPYSAMGRYKQDYPLLDDEIKLDREELLRKWNKTYALSIAADRVSLGKLIPTHRSAIEAQQAKLIDNRSKILNVEQTCYETPLDCQKTYKNLALNAIDEAAIGPDSFRTFCEGALKLANNDPQKITVTALIDAIDPYEGIRPGHERIDCYIYEKQLQSLTSLALSAPSKITDTSALASMGKLTFLQLPNNEIVDIAPLASISTLEYLDLSDNKIEDLSPLKDLTRLSFLNLNSNRVKDLTPLASLSSLQTLAISGNQVSDLSPLNDMYLVSLDVKYNRIADLSNYKPSHGSNLIVQIDANPVVAKIDPKVDAKFLPDFQQKYQAVLTWQVAFDPNYKLPPPQDKP